MQRGYVKLWRKLEDSGIIGNTEVAQLFLYLMVKVSSRPRKKIVRTQVVELESGQLVISRNQLAAELGSSEQRVSTAADTS
jgi:hypothetical protein